MALTPSSPQGERTKPDDKARRDIGVARPAVLPESEQACEVRRKRLLKAVNKYAPWRELVAQITPFSKDLKLVETLLRIYLMQGWFNLSDDETRFEEHELRSILNVPYMNVFSRIALLDERHIELIRPEMTWLRTMFLERPKQWELTVRRLEDGLAKQGLLLKRENEHAETFLVVSPEEAAAKLEANARSRFFVPLRYWSFQARLLGGIIAFQYAVMLVAPRDVLTRFPLLRNFVSAMEQVCNLMIFPAAARKDNTITYLGRAAQYPELAQLFASLMIAMLPLYLYCCYRWLGFDRKRNYRHFEISPYNRGVIEGNMAFINDGLSDEQQKKQGISTQALPGKKRSLIGIFIWSLLLFILPLGAVLIISRFGRNERSNIWDDGTLLWMKKSLLYVGDGGFFDTLFAVLGIQIVALFGGVVTAAFFCCWRDWFLFVLEKLAGCFFFIRDKLKGD
jgi:hypothetical protein